MPELGIITGAELASALRRQLAERNLTGDQAARLIGVSRSTFTYMKTRPVDPESLVRLTTWLNVPIERVRDGKIVCFPDEPPMQVLDALIFNDPELSPASRQKLSALMNAAYMALVIGA